MKLFIIRLAPAHNSTCTRQNKLEHWRSRNDMYFSCSSTEWPYDI